MDSRFCLPVQPDAGQTPDVPVYLRPPLWARFEPKHRETLKPGAVPFIGRVGLFRPLWVIETGSRHDGQIAYGVPRDWEDGSDIGFAWAPAEDLVPVFRVKLRVTKIVVPYSRDYRVRMSIEEARLRIGRAPGGRAADVFRDMGIEP